MKDIAPDKLLKSAEERHVWQYEHELAEDESEVTIKVADGTQIVDGDGKLHAAGERLSLPATEARNHIVSGRAEEVPKGRKPA